MVGTVEDQIWEKSLHADFAARCGPEFVTLEQTNQELSEEVNTEPTISAPI